VGGGATNRTAGCTLRSDLHCQNTSNHAELLPGEEMYFVASVAGVDGGNGQNRRFASPWV